MTNFLQALYKVITYWECVVWNCRWANFVKFETPPVESLCCVLERYEVLVHTVPDMTEKC